MFELDYVGDRGYDIEITRNINALPLQYLNTDNSRTTAMNDNNTALTGTVANPFRGLIPNAGSTTARSQLLLPFPEFGTINTTNNDGNTWYHSAQFILNKRFSKFYGVQFAYTRSKWLQATEYLNAADPNPTKVISDQDVPNRFTMSGFIALPFGKGQRFMSHANNLIEAILGGWQIEGTYTYQSGFPVTFSNDAFYIGGQIAIPKSQQTLNHWFNTDAFLSVYNTMATLATPVNHLRTLPLRFADVRIDPINNTDLGMRKDIRLGERMKVQLRAEFLNAFNHPLLPGPVVSPGTAGTVISGVCDNTPTRPCPGGLGTISLTNSNQLNYARRAQLGVKFIF